jgi:hypothetical protein
MAKLIRHEFIGSWILFWLMCVTIIGLPLALLYLLNGTVRVEEEVTDPEAVLKRIRG